MSIRRSTHRRPRPIISADGVGIISHAGAGLLAELATETGLRSSFSRAMWRTRQRKSKYDPGAVLTAIAVMLADGGDCLTDLAAVQDLPELTGMLPSNPTAWRIISSIGPDVLAALRRARARARVRAWKAGAAPKGEIWLDFDASLVTCHSDKEEAKGNYKGGYGYHPLLCFLHPSSEALAGVLRPGNAGSNTAADHSEVLNRAMEQLPADITETHTILVRSDSAGASHAFVNDIHDRKLLFSIGLDMTEGVREAILTMPEDSWVPAQTADGEERDEEEASVCELVDLDLSSWPEGTRAICRREIPHPGAQLTFSDIKGHRFQVIITNQTDGDAAYLEAKHRNHARVEDRIRCAKDMGMRNFPFHDFAANQVWLEMVLTAQDLVAWLQLLCFTGAAKGWEPKGLRYRLFHVAGRLTRSGRRLHLKFDARAQHREQIVKAFITLRALTFTT